MKYIIPQIVIMKFLLLNAQSFNTAKNDLYELVHKYDIDFLSLNETWENKKKPIEFRDWKAFTRPRPGSSQDEAAVFVNQSKLSFLLKKFETLKMMIWSVCSLGVKAI